MSRFLGAYFKFSNQTLVSDFERLVQLDYRKTDKQNTVTITGSFPGNLLLGYSRFSIPQLSSVGLQPMSTEDGRLTILFDGKVYNLGDIQRQLKQEGYLFKTETGTEVVLKAFHKWGINCLQKIIGMFAFCIYDNKTQKITLVRDPFGIKPMFFSQDTDRFTFSSEIQSNISLLAKKPAPDLHAAYQYLVHGNYDSSERTFFNNINRLSPGSYISFDLKNQTLSSPTTWWTPEFNNEQNITFNRATELVREIFLDNVKFHLMSNDSVGVALSGGVDSSAIVCAVRHLEPEIPIHTFSYIARDTEKSEEQWVDLVNAHTNSIPHKVIVTPNELVHDMDDLIKTQGEPFGSTNIYAQYRVFKLASENNIKTILDGQGADGLLVGQNGHPGERMLSLLEKKQLISLISFVNNWADWPGRSYTQCWMYFGKEILPDNLYKQARKFMGRDFEPDWLNMDLFKSAGVIPKEIRPARTKAGYGRRVVERLVQSLQSRGLQHLLRHSDRNSFRFSIEDQPVFLTTRFTELLCSLPEEYLISKYGQTKYIFREAMRGIVPGKILDRKDKIGFETPEVEWKGILTDKVDSNLKRTSLELVDKTKFKHKSTKFSSSHMWRILNYLQWLRLNSLNSLN